LIALDGDGLAVSRPTASDSEVPLRTTGSLSLARQLTGAGLVDRLRLMTFALIAGNSGRDPVFANMASAALELVDHRALDDRVSLEEYRPTGKTSHGPEPGHRRRLRRTIRGIGRFRSAR
jgi:dihydrofolate reductase